MIKYKLVRKTVSPINALLTTPPNIIIKSLNTIATVVRATITVTAIQYTTN